MSVRPHGSSPDPTGTTNEPAPPTPVMNPTDPGAATSEQGAAPTAPPADQPVATPNGRKDLLADGGFAAGPATKAGPTPSPATGVPNHGGRHGNRKGGPRS